MACAILGIYHKSAIFGTYLIPITCVYRNSNLTQHPVVLFATSGSSVKACLCPSVHPVLAPSWQQQKQRALAKTVDQGLGIRSGAATLDKPLIPWPQFPHLHNSAVGICATGLL